MPTPRLFRRCRVHVALNSRPDGVIVFVDGVGRGVTPVEVDLPAGRHEVVFAEGPSERRSHADR